MSMHTTQPPVQPHQTQLSSSPQVSALATATLICGLVSILFIPAALVALVLGPIAMILIHQSKGRQKGMGRTIVGTAAGAFAIAFWVLGVMMIVPIVREVIEENRQTHELANLQMMQSIVVQQMSEDYENPLPPVITQMTAFQWYGSDCFSSPYSANSIINPTVYYDQAIGPPVPYRLGDYWVIPSAVEPRQLPGELMIAFSAIHAEEQQGRGVVYISNPPVWLTDKEFAEEIENQNKYRETIGLPLIEYAQIDDWRD